MQKRKRSWEALLLCLFSFAGISYLVLFTTPDEHILLFNMFQFPLVLVWFLLVFTAVTSCMTVVFGNMRRGILFGFCLTALLLLRYFHLYQHIFAIILIAILTSMELFFSRR